MRRGAHATPQNGSIGFREPDAPDVDTLIGLANLKSAADRALLAAIADDLFGSDNGILRDQERALMHDALRRLVGDIEQSLQHHLTERLADRGWVPRGLAAALAEPDAEAIHPILLAGGALRDPGLIEAVKHRTQAHLLATSVHKRFLDDASHDPALEAEGDVITALLTRAGATISRGVTEYLIAESRRVDTFRNPLVLQRDLPFEVTERLYWRVAVALRRHVLGRVGTDREAFDDAVESAVGDALADAREDLGRPTATDALIDGMVRCGELDEGLLVQMLRQGDISLFEAGFARLVGARPNLVGRLLYEPSGEGLAVACKAAGFGRETMVTVLEMTRPVCLPRAVAGTRRAPRLGAFFDRMPQPTAAAALRHWRRSPGYLCAMGLIDGK